MHGGAVLAIPVRAFSATVTLGAEGTPLPLIDAALARVGVATSAAWTTDIPRGVGLAGSSALVIAALRASGVAPEDPLALAELALLIERDDLGIAAGLQDRAVQAFDQPVLVDGGAVVPLSAGADFDFVVAWLADAAQDSGDYHRAREVNQAGMRELARIARAAADAFTAGDADALESSMGESARLRDDVAPLPPRHNELADTLRAVGLQPNSTGSGGAVVALLRDPAVLEELRVDCVRA
jgi:glucuronokinase